MRKFFLTLIAIIPVLLMFSACEKESTGAAGAAKAAKITIELQKYYNEVGTMSLRLWEKAEKVAIFNTQSDSPSVTEGAPVSFGGQSSLFTIAMQDVQEGDLLMAYLPFDADVKGVKGGLEAEIPAVQDGTIEPVFVGTTKFTDSYSGSRMEMKPFWCTLYASVQLGPYSIKKAVLSANAGENIAGKVKINASDMSVTASGSSVTVEFDQPRDCRMGAIKFPILVAPGTLSKGFTITYTKDNGETFEYSTEENITLEMGDKYEAASSAASSTQVLVCGDNMIYLLDAELAVLSGYKNAIIWEWDAKDWYQTVGLTQGNMIRLDDCKPVDDNKKILATSSKGYAVLIDKESGKVLWYSNCSTNAHSGEILPNNRIAIACSDSGDLIQIFDIATSNSVRFSTKLDSAHGVVWNPVTERLYAIGGKTFNIYKLTDWETSSPKLTLDKSITTTNVTGLHDLTLVDENTLLLSGRKAAFYNITNGSFTNIPIFNNSTALKAVNYNGDTGECWFTDPTEVEVPNLTWASHTIRYTDDIQSKYQTKSFKVEDLNVYKVRVFNW